MKPLLPMPSFSFLAIFVLLSCMDCQKSFGIEPGFYSNFPGFKDAKPRKLLSEIGTPDQRIEFYTPNRIEIPLVVPITKRIGDVEVSTINERELKQSIKNQTGVEKALRRKHPKDLLIVFFHKGMMIKHESALESLQQFFRRLGYRRVVVLGAHSMGVAVLQDKTYPATSKNK